MRSKQALGIVGALILALGVFAPILTTPRKGTQSYLQNGTPDGVIILALAAVSFVLSMFKATKALWVTGLSSLLVLGFTFLVFQLRWVEHSTAIRAQLHVHWGWAVLIVGSVLLVVAAWMQKDWDEE